jgi:hypothetical protein
MVGLGYNSEWRLLCESKRKLNQVCISMPRCPTYLKKSAKIQVERLYQRCCYCKTHHSTRGFDKHEAWCKKTWLIRKEHRQTQMPSATTEGQAKGMPSSLQVDLIAENECVEGSGSMPMADQPPLELDPQEYIKIVPHPNSPNSTVKIIALSSLNSAGHLEQPTYMPHLEPRPWAPFENLADFEYTETAIQGLLSKWIINKQLAGINSNWAEGSQLTIKNFTNMDKVLSKARKYFVQVSKTENLIRSSSVQVLMHCLVQK